MNDDFTGCNSVQRYIDFEPGFTSVNKIYLNMSDEEKKKLMRKCGWLINQIININERILGDKYRQDTEQMSYSEEKIDSISGWSRTFARKVRDISYESNSNDIDDMLNILICLMEGLDMNDQL
uniref:HTH_OrfB_IS605 domain-containing protein n=1 Tax=Strongyloides papillosus TaxID=174720 RepID=A0A0N5CIR3_STREA